MDSLVDKGRVRPGVVSPLKTALKKIFEKTEGEAWPQTDIAITDISDTMARFKNLTLGKYSHGSYRTYELRLIKAVEWYKNFLENPGWYPTESARPTSQSPEQHKSDAAVDTKAAPSRPAPTELAQPVDGRLSGDDDSTMIMYPFPMAGGMMASLRIPRAVSQADIRRLTSFLEALVMEAADEAV